MTFDHEKIDAILNSIFPLPEEFGSVNCDYESEVINEDILKQAIFEVDCLYLLWCFKISNYITKN